MRIRLYILSSLVFITALGAFLYLNFPETYQFSFFGYSLEFPIFLWILLPVVVIFILSLAHMSFYGFLNYLSRRTLEKDIGNIKKIVLESATDNPSTTELKHKLLRPVSILLKNSRLIPTSTKINANDEEITALLTEIEKLNSGEEADLAKFKLPRDSELEIKNAALKLKNDKTYAEEILRIYPKEKFLTKSAINSFVSYADKKKIEKYKDFLTNESVLTIAQRYNSEENSLSFTHQEFIELIKNVKLSKIDFISIGKKLKLNNTPEEVLSLVYELKQEFSEANDSWIYINLDLEKIDVVQEILESSDDDEYLEFKKYLVVKNSGLKTSLDEFIH